MNNNGIRKHNQEFVNLSSRLRNEDSTVVGFVTAEINPKTGIIAAYSSQLRIYIWPRLYDIFKDGFESAKLAVPLKIINGVNPMASNINMMQVQWSPTGNL